MSCSHEAHDHDHHNHNHDHDHDHDGPDRGSEFSLFKHIDLPNVQCLNEQRDGMIQNVFKPWTERFDRSKFVESDADDQLIVTIPFTGSVKLKSIAVLSSHGDMAPSQMKVWINRNDIDFDSVDSMTPVQEWDLVRDVPVGEMPEYPTRMTKFNGVRTLTLFFPGNFSNGDLDTTRIDYIGLKGEFEPLKEDPIITVYELNANPADHPKTKSDDWVGRAIE